MNMYALLTEPKLHSIIKSNSRECSHLPSCITDFPFVTTYNGRGLGRTRERKGKGVGDENPEKRPMYHELKTRGSTDGKRRTRKEYGDTEGNGQKAFGPERPKQLSEQIFERHLFHDIGVCNHLCELFETELAISVLVGFHNSLVYDLL